MFAEVTLIGVLHNKPANLKPGHYGISTVLMGTESDKLFSEKWFSTFDEKSTLLILESSSFCKEIIPNDHPKYEEEIKHVSPALFKSDFGPDILCADTRFKDRRSGKRVVELYFKTLPYMNGTFGLKIMPETFREAQERYLTGKWVNDYIVVKDIPFNIKNFITESDKIDKDMEQYMLAQAVKYSKEYEQILIITGASHTLEMATTSGFPYELLLEINDRKEIAQNYAMLLLRKANIIFNC